LVFCEEESCRAPPPAPPLLLMAKTVRWLLLNGGLGGAINTGRVLD
jgi:hypothetical protein